MIAELIDKVDSSELVRDKIAAILVAEVSSQKTLATAAGKDPRSWELRVFLERSNPWAEFQEPDAQIDSPPIVNVALETVSYEPSASNTVERQKATATYHVDCYGYGVSEADDAGGHIAGDARAAMESQRAARLARNILMASEYTYLGLRGSVWRRQLRSLQMLQSAQGDSTVQQIVAARLSFEVEFSEFSPQVQGDVLEQIGCTVKREETGEVYLRADFVKPLGG